MWSLSKSYSFITTKADQQPSQGSVGFKISPEQLAAAHFTTAGTAPVPRLTT